jgi:cell division transport system ATP-binding protein
MIVNYKNVSVYQRSGEKILEGVNLEVNEGEFVYIIGRVGSGKSSLLETLYCELDVDEADEATVLDHNLLTIRRKEIPALRRELGVVFQDFQLLRERTVYKNLEFVLKATGWHDKERINDRIGEVLTMIGLEDMADKMPHELSGGEQQRVAIARAILNSPQLIIADEPTGNLDRDTADNIMQLLRSICEKGTAVIMTTHNMSLVNKYPGKAFQCHNGILEQVVVRKANEAKEVKE